MSGDERNVDVSRRDLSALLGVLGGATGLAALSSCLQSAQGQPATATESTAQVSQALAGGAIAWVNTVLGAAPPAARTGDLAKYGPGSGGIPANTVVAIAQGCIQPGDGGGGIFYWSAGLNDNPDTNFDASSEGQDDGGTVIVPTDFHGTGAPGSTGACWKRIFSGPLNVKWFGATGNGTTADDIAINQAMTVATALNASDEASTNKSDFSSTTSVQFPTGCYLLTSGISVAGEHIEIFSTDGAILQGASGVNIFTFAQGMRQKIRGLTFAGGNYHLEFTSAATQNLILVEDCEFEQSGSWAIFGNLETGADGGVSGSMDMIVIDRCKFYYCAGALWANWTNTMLQNSLIYAPNSTQAPFCQISNQNGNLRIKGTLFVPNLTANSSMRWIENWAGATWGPGTPNGQPAGGVDISQCSFGGENGGYSTIWTWAPLAPVIQGVQTVSQGPAIAVRDSTVLVPAGGSVITIAAGCPQTMVFEGNVGPQGGAAPLPGIIQAASGYNLANYLSGQPTAAQLVKVSVDSNVNGGLGSIVVSTLLPYVNQFQTSIFPMGVQAGNQVSPAPYHQSSFTYSIPQGVSGFVALVTVSLNPNSGSDAGLRTSATYLVSLTTNLQCESPYAQLSVLSWVPLFAQPPGAMSNLCPDPLYYPPPTLWANFGTSTASSSSPLSTTNVPGSITITWDSNVDTVTATNSVITLQPIHVIT